jgi:hypothetical protein
VGRFPLKVGLLTIATGRYVELLDGLLESARRHFFPGIGFTPFLFTDDAAERPGVVRLPIEHEPWPMVTLRRYHYFSRYASALRETDYLFYIDVDMRFVAPCEAEVLPAPEEKLVAVRHPAFFRGHRGIGSRFLDALTGGRWSSRPLPHAAFPFERSPKSLACISDPGHRVYYCGGFNGGETQAFLEMSVALRDAIDTDLGNGVIAVWHDESHLNRYLCGRTPRSLDPAYAHPQTGYPHLRHLNPVIVALDKDHAYFRDQAGSG